MGRKSVEDSASDKNRPGDPGRRNLPPRPNFDALDLISPGTADQRTFLLALIGNLAFVWSNNESMFIYIIKILLQIDEKSAVIVFSTLTNARSRIELVERLTCSRINDADLRKETLRLLLQFDDCTKIRNEFNHCMYSIDGSGAMSSTQSFRIKTTRGVPTLDNPKPIDEARIGQLINTIEEMKQFNRDVWDLLPRLQACLDRAA